MAAEMVGWWAVAMVERTVDWKAAVSVASMVAVSVGS